MRRLFFIWAGVALLLDQTSKYLVRTLVRVGDPVRLAGDWVRIVVTSNEHGVFGLKYGHQLLYLVLPIVGSSVIIWFGLKAKDRWSASAFGLVLGGALGNLIDRLMLGGQVVDFVDMGVGRLRWFTYNIADACLVVGIIMLLGREFLSRPGRQPQSGQPEPEEPLPPA